MKNKLSFHPSFHKQRDVNHIGIVMTLLVIAALVLLSQYGEAVFQMFAELFK